MLLGFFTSYSCCKWLLFLGYFWMREVFLLIIHWGMFVYSTPLLISRACMWLSDVNFFTRICVCHHRLVFTDSVFFSVALSDSRCIITSGASSSPCTSFSMLFIHSPFPLCSFTSHILLQNCFSSFASGYLYVLVHSPPTPR